MWWPHVDLLGTGLWKIFWKICRKLLSVYRDCFPHFQNSFTSRGSLYKELNVFFTIISLFSLSGVCRSVSICFLSSHWSKSFSSGVFFFLVQSLNCVWLFVIPWTAIGQAPLSSAISRSLRRFMSIESVTLFNHLILSSPLLLLPSIFPNIRVFFNELAFHVRWPKVLELQLQHQHQPFQWIFRIDFL